MRAPALVFALLVCGLPASAGVVNMPGGGRIPWSPATAGEIAGLQGFLRTPDGQGLLAANPSLNGLLKIDPSSPLQLALAGGMIRHLPAQLTSEAVLKAHGEAAAALKAVVDAEVKETVTAVSRGALTSPPALSGLADDLAPFGDAWPRDLESVHALAEIADAARSQKTMTAAQALAQGLLRGLSSGDEGAAAVKGNPSDGRGTRLARPKDPALSALVAKQEASAALKETAVAARSNRLLLNLAKARGEEARTLISGVVERPEGGALPYVKVLLDDAEERLHRRDRANVVLAVETVRKLAAASGDAETKRLAFHWLGALHGAILTHPGLFGVDESLDELVLRTQAAVALEARAKRRSGEADEASRAAFAAAAKAAAGFIAEAKREESLSAVFKLGGVGRESANPAIKAAVVAELRRLEAVVSGRRSFWRRSEKSLIRALLLWRIRVEGSFPDMGESGA